MRARTGLPDGLKCPMRARTEAFGVTYRGAGNCANGPRGPRTETGFKGAGSRMNGPHGS